jgi:glutathione S-transferase
MNWQVVEWLEYAPTFLLGSEFEVACSFVDGYLMSRTFLVGHVLTIADITVWSNLAGEPWASFTFYSQASPMLHNVH